MQCSSLYLSSCLFFGASFDLLTVGDCPMKGFSPHVFVIWQYFCNVCKSGRIFYRQKICIICLAPIRRLLVTAQWRGSVRMCLSFDNMFAMFASLAKYILQTNPMYYFSSSDLPPVGDCLARWRGSLLCTSWTNLRPLAVHPWCLHYLQEIRNDLNLL